MFVLPRQRFHAYFVIKIFFIKNMGNSESESSEGKMEQSNTNLGLLNMSSGEVSTIGASEILILVLLVWMVGKWCCQRVEVLPWMIQMVVILAGHAMYGDFAWLGNNIYCWWVVRNHYRNVKWFQSPDIEVLEEFAK